mmetsp:Transcript_182/g.632  ORF Transcript_182/g.632 Transcript_182/m.632 type:complete len:313 (+) Transcript_182:308-1246(+)
MCLLHAVHDSLLVEGAQCTQVDDLSINSKLLKLLCSFHALANLFAEAHQGNVFALLHNLGLADRNSEILVQHLGSGWELHPIHHLVLHVCNRVVVADGSLHESTGVLSVIWCQDLQSRDAGKPRSKALGVLCSNPGSCSVGTAEHNGRVDLPGRHVKRLCCRVDDVIDSLEGEVEGHELNHRPEARHSGTAGDTSETDLCDRGVSDTLGPILLQKPFGNLVCSLVLAHLFAHDVHLLVSRHLFVECTIDGISDTHRLGGRSGSSIHTAAWRRSATQPHWGETKESIHIVRFLGHEAVILTSAKFELRSRFPR